jgi:plasmid stabilization system protein ParE
VADQLILLPESVRDLTEAYRWYEERRTGLGAEFLRNVEACFDSMRRHPEMYAVAHENYRRALVRRFPYAIFYEHEAATITVYAVFHSAQDPHKWRARLS